MRYGSVCSGMEAAHIAWSPLGWETAWVSEIEPSACALLAYRLPGVPNLGDMTTIPASIMAGDVEAPDVLIGGTPCQSFSVAGQRRSLDDARGNLAFIYIEVLNAIDDVRRKSGLGECVAVWENVPGVLSTKDNAFGCFLGELVGAGRELQPAGRRWADSGYVLGPKRAAAWRVLDAQYFGVAQRRRRVFVVASAGEWLDPAAVLFESQGLRGDSPPSREAREVTPTIPARSSGGGGLGTGFDCDGGLIRAPVTEPFTLAIRGRGDESVLEYRQDGTANALLTPSGGRAGINVGAIAFDCKASGLAGFGVGEIASTMRSMGHANSHQNGGGHLSVNTGMQVRRLTPEECEALQGAHRGWTLVPNGRGKPMADGPRYKMLGNSFAVPVVRWVGERIQAASAVSISEQEAA